MTPALRLGLRAGLAVGVLRAFWVAVEHVAGVRTAHLEWVEPSYGVFLLVGVPAVWVGAVQEPPKRGRARCRVVGRWPHCGAARRTPSHRDSWGLRRLGQP